jgi:hypothetical protein
VKSLFVMLYVHHYQDSELMGSDKNYTRIPHSSVYVSSNLEEEVVSRKCNVSIGFQADASSL